MLLKIYLNLVTGLWGKWGTWYFESKKLRANSSVWNTFYVSESDWQGMARHIKAQSKVNKKWTPPPPLKEGPRSSLVTWWALRLRWCRACWMQPPRCGWAPWATSPERSVPSDWCLPTISYQILTLNYPLSPSLSPRTCQIKVGKRKLELQFFIFIIIFS